MITSRFKWNAQKFLELSSPLKAYVYYKNYRTDLLTGFPERVGISSFDKELEVLKMDDTVDHPRVYHFTYEYGQYKLLGADSVGEDVPLVIELEYSDKKFIPFKKIKSKKIGLKFLEKPLWSDYKEKFERIQNELKDGNAYQVNLTCRYDFYTDDLIDPRDLQDTLFAHPKLARYAHATFLGEELLLSNSPECLFQYQNQDLRTMPIKGTIACDGKNLKEQWKKLLQSEKEKAELLMITDLLKNDLNKISWPNAQVIKLRAPLIAPGILHQYSLLSIKLKTNPSLKQVMHSLFPGGSITGAPKKRVMEIISSTENYSREHYCGSTLLCYGDKKVASINIRTAHILWEERVWKYGAGGGITLLSRSHEEFQEMENKALSFYNLFK